MTDIAEAVTVTFDDAGNGEASIGPQVVREVWSLSYATVGASLDGAETSVEARCDLYLGHVATSVRRIAGTATGSSGDTCGLNGQRLLPGTVLTAHWTGGDPGAVGTLTVYGTRERMR